MADSSPLDTVSSLARPEIAGFEDAENLARHMQIETDMRSNLITTLLFDLDLVFGSLIWPVRRWARRFASGG